MVLTVHEHHGVTVVEVAGELDDSNSAALGQTCEQLLTEGQRQFVLDLHAVDFIDSAGLAILIRCFQRVRTSAGRFVLAAPQPAVRRILELMRLDRIFEVYPNVTEAVGQHSST